MALNDLVPSSASLAVDPRALDRLRASAGTAPEKALRDAAKQFEVLFMNMLLKSMRDAAPQDGPLDTEQTRMYTGMLDQQMAQAMATRGLGLADVMVRQLSRTTSTPAGDAASTAPASKAPTAVPEKPDVEAPADVAPSTSIGDRARAFVNRFWSHAVEAARETGLPAQFILGQAALESGWGARETRTSDGAPTHNLFNIKAGQSWRGESAEASTTEYVSGTAQKMPARFRLYPSYSAAFRDYASLLKTNGRYSRVLESGTDAAQFASELQKAGYATDPAYAAKLTRIITGNVLRGGLST